MLDEYWNYSDIDIYVSKYNKYDPSGKFNIDNFMFYNMKFHVRHDNYDNDIKCIRTCKSDTTYIIDDYGCYRAIKKIIQKVIIIYKLLD